MKNDFRAYALPFCLKKMEDGTYVILNRRYKPIGFNSKEHINYKNYPVNHKIRGINKKTAASLSWNNSEDTDNIFLYDDHCTPTGSAENMKKYLKKIEALANYKIT